MVYVVFNVLMLPPMGKSPSPRTKIRPYAARIRNAFAQQVYVVCVIHGSLIKDCINTINVRQKYILRI